MKAGAVDFLEKPIESETLLDTIQRALARDTSATNRLATRRIG